jgi:hypothetical protein
VLIRKMDRQQPIFDHRGIDPSIQPASFRSPNCFRNNLSVFTRWRACLDRRALLRAIGQEKRLYCWTPALASFFRSVRFVDNIPFAFIGLLPQLGSSENISQVTENTRSLPNVIGFVLYWLPRPFSSPGVTGARS